MRKPFPLFAAALFAAAGAFAAALPTWTPHEQPWGSWRVVNFTDENGKDHELWCRWEECSWNKTSGKAPLYVFERKSDQPYTYTEHIWAKPAPSSSESLASRYYQAVKNKVVGASSISSKTTYATLVSKYELDMSSKPNKAVAAGHSFPVEDRAQMTPAGYILIVQPPTGVADDLPAPKAPGTSTATHARRTRRKRSVKAGASVALTDSEEGWLTADERANYEAAADKKPAPAAAELLKLDAQTRAQVEINLRDAAKAGYKTLIAGKFTAKQIDLYLDIKKVPHYTGDEVELRKDERAALAKVLTATPGFANAQLAYDAAMRTVKGPGMQPDDYHVAAHRVVVKFRALIPVAPGNVAAPGAPPSRLSDADLAKLPKADQDAYNAKWNDPKTTDDEKRALNKQYADKITGLAGAPGAASGKPVDLSLIKTLPQFNLLGVDDKQKLCKGMAITGGAASCGDVAVNASADMIACMKMPTGTAAQEKQRSDCMAKASACKEQKPAAAPASTLTPEVQQACKDFLAGLSPNPNPTRSDVSTPAPPSPTTSASQTPLTADLTDTGSSKKSKSDPNFLPNLTNAIPFGLGGLLLGSFFGGPLLMLAVGLVAGVGAYYLSKSINAPSK